ncbi:F-box protein At4g00893-like isoform X2 [Mangifera indica]|uniref:F-box protein At4g00893-like isoform X2 n=1 Tax=Mangifera indica TaxID=29780 RepID=UPI001CFB9B39|nr:F-box protein At4g00893-like isoform X2 [Mangifera indica]
MRRLIVSYVTKTIDILARCSLHRNQWIGHNKMAGAQLKAEPRWADLPTELITAIADRLGLIDLLRFRSVCKSWHCAASRCSAHIESSPDFEPWFILYGEDSQCILLTGSGKSKSQKKYNINIPEFNGATCIASRDGWLLLQQETTIFFFCPFSRSRIDLPQFPNSEQHDYIGAFSSPPTSKDCIVCVVCKNDKWEVEVQLLYRGSYEWTMHKFSCYRYTFKQIKAVAYQVDEKKFHIFDEINGLIMFTPEDGNWKILRILDASSNKSREDVERLPFHLWRESFKMESMKAKLGLAGDVSIDTCGTVVSGGRRNYIHDMVFFNENISQQSDSQSQSRRLKGAWIEPRFYEISPEVSWDL